VESFLQVGFAFDGLFSHLAMLDLVPDLLVGIEFWRMGGKEEHPQLGPMGQDELTHGSRPMKRRLIRDENQGSGSPPQQLAEKRHIPLAVHRRFGHRVAQFAGGRDDGQDVIPPALVGRQHHRWVVYRTPRAPRPGPDADPGLASSKPMSAPIFSANRWIFGNLYSRKSATASGSCSAA
jgi:hypothetical protein